MIRTRTRMYRIRNTVNLAKTSWHVLQHDRELLYLPVLSFLTSVVAVVLLVVPALLTLETTQTATGETASPTPLGIALIIMAMFALGIINVFFTGALVAGAHERMSGGDPTVRSAISRAFARLPGLVPWALLTVTVGLIIRILRERAGWVGKLLLSGIQMTFEVVAFLTIPAIVIDDQSAIDGFKTSAGLLRSTFGENLTARVGFGFLGMLVTAPAFLFGGLFIRTGSAAFTIIGIAIAAAWIALVTVVLTALNAIFQTALYMYATTGSSPQGFENTELNNSFSRR